MSIICKSCGCTLPDAHKSNICEKCNQLFVNTYDEIIHSADSKYIRYCEYCGRPFIAVKQVTYAKSGKTVKRATNRKYCDRHYAQCKNCGKPIPFKSSDSWVPSTCCKACENELRAKNIRNTFNEKYGVNSAMQCPEFVQKYKDNYLINHGVSNPFELNEVREKCKSTMLDRYGVDSPIKSTAISDNIKQTNLIRYGVEYPTQSSDIKEKIRNTVVKRYGVDNPMQSPLIQQRINQTSVQRYGTLWPTQSSIVKSKIEASNECRYGGKSPFNSDDVKLKRTMTWLSKYGVDHPMKVKQISQKTFDTQKQKYGGIGNSSSLLKERYRAACIERYGDRGINCDEITAKRQKTLIDKYGADHPMKVPQIKDKVRWHRIFSYADTIEDSEARDNYINFCSDPRSYILNKFDHKPSLIEISETLGGLDCTSVSARIPAADHQLLGRYQTTMKRSVCDFLKSIDPDMQIVVHDRSIIKPYELDIWLPQYQIAIECNPTATHNSTVNIFCSDEKPLNYNYHKIKSDKAMEAGIFLFHIFGYEWSNKQDIVKSMIINLLHKNTNKYYARKLRIISVTHKDSIKFLSHNHLQGATSSAVRIGLVDETGQLISLMMFNKQRSTLGKHSVNYDDNEWELTRLCNKLGCSVVRGASKLLSYFLKKCNPSKIISFSDRAHTSGKLYQILGFNQVSQSDPSYVWVNMNSDGYLSRVSCQKRNVQKTLKDSSIDIQNKTEKQIMAENGYVQVFDSGKLRWEYLVKSDSYRSK